MQQKSAQTDTCTKKRGGSLFLGGVYNRGKKYRRGSGGAKLKKN